MRTLILISFVLPLTLTRVNGQDPHFSQYQNLPLYLNPAHTGNGIQHVRAVMAYRNQWASISSPFTTQAFMLDKAVGRFGFGLSALHNGAGSAGFNETFLNGNLAYHIPVSKYAKLSAGIQAGMFNKSINLSNLTFDSQYIEDVGFNADLPNGEILSNTSITRPDLGFGFMYQRGFSNPSLKLKPYAGVSFLHINQPKETFITEKNTLPIRQTYQLGVRIMLNEKTELKPSSVVMIQDHHHEVFTGALLNYLLPNLNKLQFGLMLRNNDAVIAYAGYQISQLFIGTSYDVNYSSLKRATGGKGGFEITLSYIPKRKIYKAEEQPKTRKTNKTVKPEKVVKADLQHNMKLLSNPSHPMQIALRTNQQVAQIHQPVPKIEPTSVIVTAKPELRTEKEINTSVPAATKTQQPEVVTNNPVSQANDQLNTSHPEHHTTSSTKPKQAVDTDGDGIADDQDDCPFIKGPEATRGCPDSDGDSLIDMKDKCPFEAGPAENYGCPIKVPTLDKSKIIKQFRNIEFETGKAIVRTPDIYDIIEHAIDVMYQYPASSIILSGHTDSEGDALHNMRLSEARVNTVRRYLIGQGINEKRIKTVYYGETMPLMDNSTDYGKARNRRVEINIFR
ncbi:MAG: PorP/SprF family type IX secretion system membrane protein [Bacteroidia bacterium]|nr:PorP/SprF family type IX secretion system membrane protein [Bacteroidia bacterium]MCZ2276489.1 PorP/SprF family type IX secretion system membrane protein [Bacteroidia bacterium]